MSEDECCIKTLYEKTERRKFRVCRCSLHATAWRENEKQTTGVHLLTRNVVLKCTHTIYVYAARDIVQYCIRKNNEISHTSRGKRRACNMYVYCMWMWYYVLCRHGRCIIYFSETVFEYRRLSIFTVTPVNLILRMVLLCGIYLPCRLEWWTSIQ